VIQSRALGGGFTTDEMKSAFDILTGGYFKQDTSKSSNPQLNDKVVENNEGLSIDGVKYSQASGQGFVAPAPPTTQPTRRVFGPEL